MLGQRLSGAILRAKAAAKGGKAGGGAKKPSGGSGDPALAKHVSNHPAHDLIKKVLFDTPPRPGLRPLKAEELSAAEPLVVVRGGRGDFGDAKKLKLFPKTEKGIASSTAVAMAAASRIPQNVTEERIRHETIERAWKLYQDNLEKQRKDEADTRMRRMQEALNDLQKMDGKLFYGATRWKMDPLVPRQMRVPTETPPTGNVWNYTVQKKATSPHD
ncbi:hypothetical protein GQ42DRAFT_74847 [Ramicandelaber brevisporus]|nr:hypothetical protein GQ42DRAFT_74847 [Ramicandelaber brevisporus]